MKKLLLSIRIALIVFVLTAVAILTPIIAMAGPDATGP